MNVGIIGAGSLGTALGARLGECGHVIMFGGGASAKDAAERQRARVGSNAETAAFGDVVILAVPFPASAQRSPTPDRFPAGCCGPA
jgi:8-hydroxy-5-deazaflavin:NADPH oxidoreductase